jgi:hypothetical protein
VRVRPSCERLPERAEERASAGCPLQCQSLPLNSPYPRCLSLTHTHRGTRSLLPPPTPPPSLSPAPPHQLYPEWTLAATSSVSRDLQMRYVPSHFLCPINPSITSSKMSIQPLIKHSPILRCAYLIPRRSLSDCSPAHTMTSLAVRISPWLQPAGRPAAQPAGRPAAQPASRSFRRAAEHGCRRVNVDGPVTKESSPYQDG